MGSSQHRTAKIFRLTAMRCHRIESNMAAFTDIIAGKNHVIGHRWKKQNMYFLPF